MTQAPPGWYPDPGPIPHGVPRGSRYWDGRRWTEHVARAGHSQVAVARVRTTPDGEPLAGWWPRVGAPLLDSLILTPVLLLAGWPFLHRVWGGYMDFLGRAVRASQAGGPPPDPTDVMNRFLWPLLGFAAISLAGNLVYNAGFLKWRQATPGKLIVGLRVRLRERPGAMSWGTVVLRWLGQNWYALPVLVPLTVVPFLGSAVSFYPLLDDLWPLWDERNQAVHDKLARTNVVVHRPQE